MRKVIVFILTIAAASAVGAAPTTPAGTPQTAIFAGGRFWTLQSDFEKVYGVIKVEAGYTGGTSRNPNHDTYAAAGHVEAVQVTWDPARVTYQELLDAYWHRTNPTDGGGQFVDRGAPYRPIVYYMNEQQKAEAEASRAALSKSGKLSGPVATEIAGAAPFYRAEDKYQDYSNKNPENYMTYYSSSGRREFFAKIWGPNELVDPAAPPMAAKTGWTKPSKDQLRKILTRMQFDVTQQDGTEPPFENEYFNNEKPGIYVDIVSGEPLFSSTDKFDSGTGWPSFTRPLAPSNVVIRMDRSFGMERNEVRSRYADSHLGHLFDDGPMPTKNRYCMDSASLRFIPVQDMQKEGYGQYLKLFQKPM
ncbi:MAG: peptide-methionine (R)-S-oxide reductase MsrB [Spirochaetia bacterium]|jgi:peptide methionine sulfoxide reductase msrA/msrB